MLEILESVTQMVKQLEEIIPDERHPVECLEAINAFLIDPQNTQKRTRVYTLACMSDVAGTFTIPNLGKLSSRDRQRCSDIAMSVYHVAHVVLDQSSDKHKRLAQVYIDRCQSTM
jgi:hypothetical protein